MKTYTPRQVRNAVLLAVLLTVVAMLALLDRSCERVGSRTGPSRSLAPI